MFGGLGKHRGSVPAYAHFVGYLAQYALHATAWIEGCALTGRGDTQQAAAWRLSSTAGLYST